MLPDSYTCPELVRSCIRARKWKIVDTLLEVFKSNGKVSVLAFGSAMRSYNKLHMYRSPLGKWNLLELFQITNFIATLWKHIWPVLLLGMSYKGREQTTQEAWYMMKLACMWVGGHQLRGRDSAGGVDLRWSTKGFFLAVIMDQ